MILIIPLIILFILLTIILSNKEFIKYIEATQKNITSKEILYSFVKEEHSAELSEMIEYFKKNESIRYNI